MSELRIDDDGTGVRTLTLDRPEVRNALSLQLRRSLPEALSAADADPAVRVIVVTGAGGHFCAGADIAALDRDWTPTEAAEYMRTLAQAAPPPLPLGLARLGLDRSLDTPLEAFLDWEADAVALCLTDPEHRRRVTRFLDAKQAKRAHG